jgi:glycosyltransferase involved in cell wall biosynthesis
MNFSVIIPAHNEEDFIETGLEAIQKAEKPKDSNIEIIVILNRCTDRTEEIARSYGARIVKEDAKILSVIRNAGVKEAKHEVIVTIDADSVMSENLFIEIEKALESGKYIGGGVWIDPERWSFPIWLTFKLLRIMMFFTGFAGGVYWCYKTDFDALGGFNEKVDIAEDLEFAYRLKKYGKKQKKKFTELKKARIVTSCRKFDVFGDWFLFRVCMNPVNWFRALLRKTRPLANKIFYDFSNKEGKEKQRISRD